MNGRAVSAQLLKKALGVGSKAIPVIGQANLGKQLLGKVSEKALGYDFVGLITKIGFFYAFAFVLIKYFEAVIFGSGVVKTLGSLAGINLNPALPQSVLNFFKDGLVVKKADTVKATPAVTLMPWDIVNILLFSLLCAEAIQYFEENKSAGRKISWLTVGVWGLIIGSAALLLLVPLYGKLKGIQKMTASDLVAKYGTTLSSTTNFQLTILDPKTNLSTAFVMTPQQVVSLPTNIYVTAGPVLTSNVPSITDQMFNQLFGVTVGK